MNRSEQHVVLKCSSAECGMRYPSPADDERRDECVICASPTQIVGTYESPYLPGPEPRPAGELVGVLDNIRSALNVGTMLRSADGARLDHVHLCGLTAGVDNPKVVKTALGAERSVPSTSNLDAGTCVAALKSRGFDIWAIEHTPTSTPLPGVVSIPEKLAFVVGNERAGVDPDLLRVADRQLHLPMAGAKTSLNVGVVFGIAAYLLRALPLDESDC